MSSNTPEFNTEEPVRVNHRARNIVIAVVVIAALAVAAFFGYRAMNKNDNAPKGSETNPVVIGVVGATDPPRTDIESVLAICSAFMGTTLTLEFAVSTS